jgi:hypothetical protein
LYIIILELGSEGNKTSGLILDRTDSKPTKGSLIISEFGMTFTAILRINGWLKLLQSHVQNLKNKTPGHENEILRTAHGMNYQITRIKYSLAVVAAQCVTLFA